MINEATPLPLTANGRILKDSARIVPDNKTGVRFGVRVDSHTSQTIAAHAVGIGGEGRNRTFSGPFRGQYGAGVEATPAQSRIALALSRIAPLLKNLLEVLTERLLPIHPKQPN